MKLVHISFRFEYTEDVDLILQENQVADFVLYPMIQGRGQDGKHFGTQVFPGNFSVVQAAVEDHQVKRLLEDLQQFRQSKKSHEHLRAWVVPVEQGLDPGQDLKGREGD
ncbi:MAG: PG0541 family transporter-associated protein [Desulfonatronovibrionaceae bacterium]